MPRSRIALLGLVAPLLILWSCRPSESVRIKPVKTDSGLTVSLPSEGYEIEKTTAGIKIRPANWRSLREPTEIDVEARNSIPEGDFRQHRRVGDRDASYRIDVAAGGSGGEERTLQAWVYASTGGVIYLRQYCQSEEPSERDFDIAWQILASARIEK
jgi:hypothetical protein